MKTVFAASLLAVSAVGTFTPLFSSFLLLMGEAFEITAPAADATWGQTGDHVVTWTNTESPPLLSSPLTRSSDPDFFAMYLVNNEMKVPAVVTIDANGSPPPTSSVDGSLQVARHVRL